MARIFWAANAQSHNFESRIVAACSGNFHDTDFDPATLQRDDVT